MMIDRWYNWITAVVYNPTTINERIEEGELAKKLPSFFQTYKQEPVCIDFNSFLPWVKENCILGTGKIKTPNELNMAPPFSVYWTEHRECIWNDWIKTIGIFVISLDLYKTKLKEKGTIFGLDEDGQEIINNARWVNLLHVFWESKDGYITRPLIFNEMLNEKGEQVGGRAESGHEEYEMTKEELVGRYKICTTVYYAGINFLNCKNVTTKNIPIDEKLQKKRRKIGKRPLLQFKTLVVDGNDISKTYTDSGKTGIKMPLHICRGHFATYTQDAPLFGKVTGTFWKSMHVRGNKKYGVVQKDYKIKP